MPTITPTRILGVGTLGTDSLHPGTAPSIVVEVVNPPAGAGATGGSVILQLVFNAGNGGGVLSSGTLSANDSKGNVYTLDKLVTNSTFGLSVATLSAHNANQLAAGDLIAVSFGSSKTGWGVVTADEYTGLILEPFVATQGTTAGTAGPIVSGNASAAGGDQYLVVGNLSATGALPYASVDLYFEAGLGYTTRQRIPHSDSEAQVLLLSIYQITASGGNYSADSGSTFADNYGRCWGGIVSIYRALDPTAAMTGVGHLTAGAGRSVAMTGVGVLSVAAKAKVTFTGVGTLTAGGSTGTEDVKLTGVGHLTALSRVGVRAKANFTGVARLRAGRIMSLWNDLGLLIGRINSYGSIARANLDQDLLRIVNNFIAKPDIEGIHETYASFGEALTGWRTALAEYADRRIQDEDRVVRELRLTDDSLDGIFEALGLYMLDNRITLNRSNVTVSTPVPGGDNIGNGICLLTTVLDGSTPPLQDGAAHTYYDRLQSELALPYEQMRLTCSADSQEGAQEGAETFDWFGNVASDELTWDVEGSGQGPSVTVAGEGSILENASFEDWSGDEPAGWDIDAGTATTHFVRDADIVVSAHFDQPDPGASGTLSVEALTTTVYAGSILHFTGPGMPSPVRCRVFATAETGATEIVIDDCTGDISKHAVYAGHYRGENSLKVTSQVTLSQLVFGTIQPLKRYLVTVTLKANNSYGVAPRAILTGVGSLVATGHSNSVTPSEILTGIGNMVSTAHVAAIGPLSKIRLQFTGTDYTAAADEQIYLLSAYFPTDWKTYYFWINTPADIPDDFRLSLEVELLNEIVDVWIDSIVIAEVVYHGGLGAVLVPGNKPFLKGDEFVFIAQNDQGGVFQEFLRKYWRVQLPSIPPAPPSPQPTPVVSDSLAT